SPSSRRHRRRCRTASGRSPAPPPRRVPSARSRRRSAITSRWPGSLSTVTGSGRSSPMRKPISRRTDGFAVRRGLLLGGCLAGTVVGASLPGHGHETSGTGRDREAADAAAPAFGTLIDFEMTDAGGNRVRAVDLRGRWLLIFFGYTYCPDLCPTALS